MSGFLSVGNDLPFLIELTGLVTIWREIGIHLGVPVDQLDAIQQNNRGGVSVTQDCLMDMFIWWLCNGKETTVEKLIMAVHAVGKHDIEKKISHKYGKSKITITVRSTHIPYLASSPGPTPYRAFSRDVTCTKLIKNSRHFGVQYRFLEKLACLSIEPRSWKRRRMDQLSCVKSTLAKL